MKKMRENIRMMRSSDESNEEKGKNRKLKHENYKWK